MSRKSAFELGQLLGRCLMGSQNDEVQRGYNQARREHIGVILDTIAVAKEAKAGLEAIGFGTSEAVWGPGGKLDQILEQKKSEREAEIQEVRIEQRRYEEEHKVEIEAERTRNFYGAQYFAGWSDQKVYDWSEAERIKQRESDRDNGFF